MTDAIEELMHCHRCGRYFHVYVRPSERLNPDTWKCPDCKVQCELLTWID